MRDHLSRRGSLRDRAAIIEELSASLDDVKAAEDAIVDADDELLALIAAREAAVHRGTPTFSADEVFSEHSDPEPHHGS